MKLSTILTLRIGEVAGVLLTTAFAWSGIGRFSLRLCPVPAVPDETRSVSSAGEIRGPEPGEPEGIKRKRREARAFAHAAALPRAPITPNVFVAGGAGIASMFTLTKHLLIPANVIAGAILFYVRIGW